MPKHIPSTTSTEPVATPTTTTWYRASYGGIEPVHVVKRVGESLVLWRKEIKFGGMDAEMRATSITETWMEDKVRITSHRGHYFPSWTEARDHLLAEAEYKLATARRAFEAAQAMHECVVGMKPPAGPAA